jgi:hypothetical protein
MHSVKIRALSEPMPLERVKTPAHIVSIDAYTGICPGLTWNVFDAMVPTREKSTIPA